MTVKVDEHALSSQDEVVAECYDGASPVRILLVRLRAYTTRAWPRT